MTRGDWVGLTIGLGLIVVRLTAATMYLLGRHEGSIAPDDEDGRDD